ncbi:hypothetical protein CHU98_g6826 [Xylaria longipes]|nr:hypothetical protein CHU98_g6826 [Xylaria longipes]
MTVKSDLIASLVQQEFDNLPAKRKPVVRDNGLREWVPLSGIVAEEKDGKLTCLSLATGMKCLPSPRLPQARGNVLHDWHAEVLAIRAFNCFVLDECRALASGAKSSSAFIWHRGSSEVTSSSGYVEINCAEEMTWHGQPFAWREDVRLYMYCSEAPCGDASMELTMASQADATPWAIPTLSPQENPPSAILTPTTLGQETLLPGRAYFSQLGIVRRKPSRGDAPPTLSKSCSDKLSLHQCTSLLSSLASLLVNPEHAYISTLILPAAQYSASGCRRAFSDGRDKDENEGIVQQQARMAALATQTQQDGGYAFRPFSVETTDVEFAFSRRSTTTHSVEPHRNNPKRRAARPQGVGSRRPGRELRQRRRMWGLAVEVADLLTSTEPNVLQIRDALGATSPLADAETGKGKGRGKGELLGASAGVTYAHVKNCALLGPRGRVKDAARREALRGWVRNLGDEDFVL